MYQRSQTRLSVVHASAFAVRAQDTTLLTNTITQQGSIMTLAVLGSIVGVYLIAVIFTARVWRVCFDQVS